jgi:predicted O-methyltransferase YrrM
MSEQLISVVNTALEFVATPLLPESILGIPGHGSPAVSTLFNAICHLIPECRYLEFGTFAGRSLAAAAYGNAGVYRGVDKLQWTGSTVKFDSVEDLKATLASSLALCRGSNVGVIESDFRRFTPEFPAYDVFFYDADHGYEATRDGILMLLPYLKPGVLIVDDYMTHGKSSLIQQGTMEALASANVAKTWTLAGKGWHTGLFVAVIS